MKVDYKTGLLCPVRYQSSSFCDDRPDPNDISLIVLHGISLPPGEFGTGKVAQFFCNQLDFKENEYYKSIEQLKVSAHLLIERNGIITQFVPFFKRAWHAGVSNFEGRERCNDFSIGIELEGTDTVPYEKVQYEVLINVIKILMAHYPSITRERITGHSNIAPGRKTDPGPSFDWKNLDCLLA